MLIRYSGPHLIGTSPILKGSNMIVSMRSKNGIENSFINLDNVREILVDVKYGGAPCEEKSVQISYLHGDSSIYYKSRFDIEDFLSVMEEIVANSYATRSYP